MVKIGAKKEIKEIEIVGRNVTLDIIARHNFGISIVSLSLEEALKLREEIRRVAQRRDEEREGRSDSLTMKNLFTISVQI